jgi:hypothetical protein
MTTLKAEAMIAPDGKVTISEPLPGWVKPGHARVLILLDEGNAVPRTVHPNAVASAEMVARRKRALDAVRQLNPYRDIEDPAKWQREIRRDRPLPSRD